MNLGGLPPNSSCRVSSIRGWLRLQLFVDDERFRRFLALESSAGWIADPKTQVVHLRASSLDLFVAQWEFFSVVAVP